jgi:hypothetical protein
MKNLNLEKGKKLNKKELRVITGGLMQCRDQRTNGCRVFSNGCAEIDCRPGLIP